MKLLFLDVDGVLNYMYCKHEINGFLGVDPKKVTLLKKIIDATGAKIVLSSTWRRHILVGMPIDMQTDLFAIDLMTKLQEEGLKIYDYTSVDKDDGHRAEQIKDLIAEYRHNGQQIESWCVLDDDWFDGFEEPEFEKHFVKTSFFDGGLSNDDVQKAINILNNGETE